MQLISLTILIMALPLAVAGQNFAILLAGLLLIYDAVRGNRLSRVISDRPSVLHLILFAAYGFTCMVSTWLNPDNPANPFVACGGFLGIWLLPGLVSAADPGGHSGIQKFCDRAVKWVPVLTLVWGLLALSQMIFGWKLSGSQFVASIPRAQGLYSHPLTLAYVALLIFPFATVWMFRQPKRWQSVATFAGVFLLLIASKSRAAQAVALLILIGNIWLLLKGKLRIAILAAVIISVTGVFVTNNPVSQRFKETIDRHDVYGEYVDDRVVFWQVHLEMFKEKPLLGHGENLGTQYRTKYYNALGLQDFFRKYEAHNVYLQILVNAGLIGFLFFLVWIGWVLVALARSRGLFFGSAPLQSVMALLLGGMTQNAFQDSEVRYALMLSVIIAVSCVPRKISE